jgi:hypothetical protein
MLNYIRLIFGTFELMRTLKYGMTGPPGVFHTGIKFYEQFGVFS